MNFADRDGWIWFDGEFKPWREATTHVLTHTLHYGLGVFEGERAYSTSEGASIFRLEEHTKRLFNSAKILNMSIPFSQEQINTATCETVKRNKLDSAYIRPMCFYGSEGMGLRASNLKVHCIIAAWEWGAYLGEENMVYGIRIKTSSYTRHHINTTMCRAKANGNYINSMLALEEAIQDGYDEALLLDVNGFVMEGSGENFFMVNKEVVYTPLLTSALDGITRNTIIQLAQEEGLLVVEKNITRDEVYIADEAFFTGTAAEVTPIREFDRKQIHANGRGPITELLQNKYFEVTAGKSSQHRNWLTQVG